MFSKNLPTCTIFFFCLLGVACAIECPPADFDSVKSLNLTKYVSSPWYVQEQMVVSYQPENTLYCVRASYELVNPDDLSEGINVYNYANLGEVNGPEYGAEDFGVLFDAFSDIFAIIPDLDDVSKLKVGPKFFSTIFGKYAEWFYGPYWIVALGPETEDSYEWAIVSGGAPEVETDTGCSTACEWATSFKINGVGLWLMAHNQTDPAATEMMKAQAQEMGFDISILKKVEQEGCLYLEGEKDDKDDDDDVINKNLA